MKPLKRNPVKQAAMKLVLRKRSLVAMKSCVKRNSASALPPGDGSRDQFGIIPRGAKVEVVSWPKL